MHVKWLGLLLAASLAGCATKVQHQAPEQKSEKRYDINRVMASSEVYIVYRKNEQGTPLGILSVEKSAKPALAIFRDNADAITRFDCIRLLPQNAKQPTTVCDESLWFQYGKRDASRLTTRKVKDAPSAVVGGVVATALTPLTVALDILSFDPEFKQTRSSLTTAVSDPAQDYEELAAVRSVVEVLFNNKLYEDRQQALGSVDHTAAFIAKYPGLNHQALIDAALQRAVDERSDVKMLSALQRLPVTPEQKDRGLAFLRSLNTFSGYAKAFDVSNSKEDAKKAQQLAGNSKDKRQVEYMAMKLLKLKNVSLDNLFRLAVKDELSGGSLRADRGSGGFLSFKESVNAGLSDFKVSIGVGVNRDLNIFKYGVYDVKVKCTLSLPQRFYRRSFWLGNADENVVNKFEESRTARIAGPAYRAAQMFEFKGITVNYKDRGSAGGTTEITMNGKPSVECGVENVELVV